MTLICEEIKNIKQSEFNFSEIKQYLFDKGKTVFLYPNFNSENFINRISDFMKTELKVSSEIELQNNEIYQITYFPENKIVEKLGITEKYNFIAFFGKTFMKYAVVSSDFFFEKGKKKSYNPLSLLSGSGDKKISSFITEKLLSEYRKIYPKNSFTEENIFIKNIKDEEIILLNELCNHEKILVKFDISDIKTVENKDKLKNVSAFVTFSEKNVFLVLQNTNNDITDCFKVDKIERKKSFLAEKYLIGTYILQLKRSDLKPFGYLLKLIDIYGKDREIKVAEFNFILKSYEGVKKIIALNPENEQNAYDKFLLFLSDYNTDKNNLKDYVSDKDISNILKGVLNYNEEDKFLNKLFEKLNVEFDDEIVFLNLFSEYAETKSEQEKVAELFKIIRPRFQKKNKNAVNNTVFDIKYAEFLIKYGNTSKARKLLKTVLKHLPDETISNLLPPDDLDLTSSNSGQILKVKVLDLLAEAKGKENAADEVQKTAVLQPLNKSRIEYLVSVPKIKNRAEEAMQILNGKALFSKIEPVCSTNYRPLSDNDINNVLPYSGNEKKGNFYNLQKWISKVKEDDYLNVKKYSEKIIPETHNTLFAVLKNTCEVFNLKETEFFISKGDRKTGITGFSGNPNFVLIGSEHVNRDSSKFMNLAEIRFYVAAEIAHIYFKHTKLTSKDIWRGLIDKGAVFADTALAVIPAASIFSKAVKNVPRLNSLTKIFTGAASGISGGKTVYDAALRLSEYYGKLKKFPKKEKQQSLLAASRMMQCTADRTGLLLCGNLTSAVRAIFLIADFEEDVFEEIKQTSLKEFLLKQNSNGTFKHQETALRIANLFSFYFSEEYSILRKKIEKGK